jgi:hypothetical protein
LWVFIAIDCRLEFGSVLQSNFHAAQHDTDSSMTWLEKSGCAYDLAQ